MLAVRRLRVTWRLFWTLILDAAERIKRRFSFDDKAGKSSKELVRTSDGRMKELDRKLIAEVITARTGHLCRLIDRALDQSDAVFIVGY